VARQAQQQVQRAAISVVQVFHYQQERMHGSDIAHTVEHAAE
jgi:hypothetical protein